MDKTELETGLTISEGLARRQERRVKEIMAERALDFAQAMNVYIEEEKHSITILNEEWNKDYVDAK